MLYLEGKCGCGDRGSPEVDSVSPFGSLDFCTKFGGVLVMVLGYG